MDIKRKINLSHFLPSVTRDSGDIQEVMRIENPELQAIWDVLLVILNDQFIPTMTEYGLNHWESIFNVIPLADDTYESRRARILLLLAGTRPYTLEKLQEVLDAAYGAGEVRAELFPDKYELHFILSDKVKHLSTEIVLNVEPIIPKNLIFKSLFEARKDTNLSVGGIVSNIRGNKTILRKRSLELDSLNYVGGRLVYSELEITRR